MKDYIEALILNGIDETNAGFYRDVRVRIVNSNTILPNQLKVPELMKEFNDWLLQNNNNNILLKAIESHYRFVAIHQFIDGNGRTALILMNNDYCPIIIRTINRKRYLNSIENYSKNKEQYMIFMLKSLNSNDNNEFGGII